MKKLNERAQKYRNKTSIPPYITSIMDWWEMKLTFWSWWQLWHYKGKIILLWNIHEWLFQNEINVRANKYRNITSKWKEQMKGDIDSLVMLAVMIL